MFFFFFHCTRSTSSYLSFSREAVHEMTRQTVKNDSNCPADKNCDGDNSVTADRHLGADERLNNLESHLAMRYGTLVLPNVP
jgi:hypothetical protein